MNTDSDAAARSSQALAAITYAARLHAGAVGVARGTEAGYNRAGKLLYRHSVAAGQDFFALAGSYEPAELLRLAAAQSPDGRLRVGVGYFAALQGVARRHASAPGARAAQGPETGAAPSRRSLLARVLRR